MPLVLVFGPIRNFLNQHKHLLLLLFIMSVAKSAGLEKRLTLIFDTKLTEQCIQRSDSRSTYIHVLFMVLFTAPPSEYSTVFAVCPSMPVHRCGQPRTTNFALLPADFSPPLVI